MEFLIIFYFLFYILIIGPCTYIERMRTFPQQWYSYFNGLPRSKQAAYRGVTKEEHDSFCNGLRSQDIASSGEMRIFGLRGTTINFIL